MMQRKAEDAKIVCHSRRGPRQRVVGLKVERPPAVKEKATGEDANAQGPFQSKKYWIRPSGRPCARSRYLWLSFPWPLRSLRLSAPSAVNTDSRISAATVSSFTHIKLKRLGPSSPIKSIN